MNYSELRNKFTTAIENSELTSNARHVGHCLVNRMNNTTGLCCPSITTISNKTGMSESSVKRGVKELKQNGYIQVNQKKTTTGLRNTYRLSASNVQARGWEDTKNGRNGHMPNRPEVIS